MAFESEAPSTVGIAAENRQSIYDEEITNITNIIHECSRKVEEIEGKVLTISDTRERPSPPETGQGSESAIEVPRIELTTHGRELVNLRNAVRSLYERLDVLSERLVT